MLSIINLSLSSLSMEGGEVSQRDAGSISITNMICRKGCCQLSVSICYKVLESKVAFITPSSCTIEASHPGLMRQFELYAINTQSIAQISVAACLASGRLSLFTYILIPRQVSLPCWYVVTLL